MNACKHCDSNKEVIVKFGSGGVVINYKTKTIKALDKHYTVYNSECSIRHCPFCGREL